MIVLTVIVGGLAGMLGGHDILDSTLMVFLISGTYLACGKTIPPVSDGPATSRMTSHHGRPILLNLTPRMALQTASVTCRVVALPPTSGVIMPASPARSMARIS